MDAPPKSALTQFRAAARRALPGAGVLALMGACAASVLHPSPEQVQAQHAFETEQGVLARVGVSEMGTRLLLHGVDMRISSLELARLATFRAAAITRLRAYVAAAPADTAAARVLAVLDAQPLEPLSPFSPVRNAWSDTTRGPDGVSMRRTRAR